MKRKCTKTWSTTTIERTIWRFYWQWINIWYQLQIGTVKMIILFTCWNICIFASTPWTNRNMLQWKAITKVQHCMSLYRWNTIFSDLEISHFTKSKSKLRPREQSVTTLNFKLRFVYKLITVFKTVVRFFSSICRMKNGFQYQRSFYILFQLHQYKLTS